MQGWKNSAILFSNKSALCRITSLAFSFVLTSHTHWLRCDFFFLFPRLYNLNDCAHHHCSHIPWSSTDVASVNFWRIFPQKHVSKLLFGTVHFRWQKLPLWNAPKSTEPTLLVVPKSRDPPVDLTVFNSFKWSTFQGNCCNINIHSWFEALQFPLQMARACYPQLCLFRVRTVLKSPWILGRGALEKSLICFQIWL